MKTILSPCPAPFPNIDLIIPHEDISVTFLTITPALQNGSAKEKRDWLLGYVADEVGRTCQILTLRLHAARALNIREFT